MYYLYRHVSPEDETVVYVGVGTKDRAWQYQNRQPDHKNWLDQLFEQGFTLDAIVQIDETSLSKEQALEIELGRINDLKPTYNRNFRRNGVCKLDEMSFERAKCMREDGFTYKSIAEELRVATMTIHRALTGGTKKYDEFL